MLEKTLESALEISWRVPWRARRPCWSILKEINPEYSLGGLMLKLKLQYFGYLIQIAKSLEKALMLGKIEVRKRKWQRIKWFDGITDSMDVSLNKLQEMVKDREAWCAACSPWGGKELDTPEQLNKKEQCSLCPCKVFFRSQARIPKDTYTAVLFFLNSDYLNFILNLPQ